MYRFAAILVLSVGLLGFLQSDEPNWTLRFGGRTVTAPPIPTIADSPVKYLSELLAAAPTERAAMLADQSSTRRAFWERKLTEYEAIPEGFRQARLRTAQLHWYLALLIGVAPEARMGRLNQIPEVDRVLVERRMKQWDELPQDLRSDILANIKVMQYFARLVSSSPEQRKALLKTSDESSNPMNDPALSWQSLSRPRQQQMFEAYANFLELPPMQQEAAIAKVPVPARAVLKARVEQLEKMPEELRDKCMLALDAYTKMTPAERSIFRGNAERWRSMTDSERNFWATYVKRLPPLPAIATSRLN